MKWQVFILILAAQLSLFAAPPLKKPLTKPQLLVVIVIDQLRSDYLTRFEKRFLPPGKYGFKYLMSEGAYFPHAEYNVLHSMTCSGHAMISTGAHPVMNGIIMNDWFDKNSNKKIYCADDEKYGLSPRNLKTTTFSDELKNAGYKSQVVGISLKDRSAIMLTGHRPDHVYWIDEKNFQWTTSTYYRPDKSVPSWVNSQNETIKKLLGKEAVWESNEKTTGLTENADGPFKKTFKYGDKDSVAYPFGVHVTLDLAMTAVKELKLGKSGSPDVLAVSLSSHDILGHRFGPNAREMEEMIVEEDRALSKFLGFLNKEGLLDKSLIVLTADHGVAPAVEYVKANKLDVEKINYLNLYKNLNAHLDRKFGKPKKEWIASHLTLNFYFDRSVLSDKKLSLEEVEKEAKKVLSKEPGVWFVFTSSEVPNGLTIPPELSAQALRQYESSKSGDVVIIPVPFFFPDSSKGTTHLTGFNYDRSVPIIFSGKNIRSGIYPQQANVIDIAPTLSFIYGVLPPATSSGKILEIFE
jgi:predicted AlkP superfamily pyrophosphatase or phosphodiesterase